MPARKGTEIRVAPNEFTSTIKIPSVSATLKANPSKQMRRVFSSKGNILMRIGTVDRHLYLHLFFLPH